MVRENDGSDITDLVGEIEDAFDIPIPNKVASTLETPGMVFDYLLEAGLHSMPSGPGLSQALFNRVRRAVLVEFQVNRQDVKPKTLIAKLIPRFRIRARRTSLFGRLSLRRPPPIIVGWQLFRRNFGSFGDLTSDILAWNYGPLAEEAGSWNPKEAWDCLRRIIAYHAAYKIEKITRNAYFVRDLHMD